VPRLKPLRRKLSKLKKLLSLLEVIIARKQKLNVCIQTLALAYNFCGEHWEKRVVGMQRLAHGSKLAIDALPIVRGRYRVVGHFGDETRVLEQRRPAVGAGCYR
jgi:hypothetical protein